MDAPKTIEASGIKETNGFHGGNSRDVIRKFRWLGMATILLALCFSRVLFYLTRYALGSELYSYILLVPFISIYLAWMHKNQLAVSKPATGMAMVFIVAAICLLGIYWGALRSASVWTEADRLFILTLGFLFLFWAGCAAFMGTRFLKSAAFPLGFLVFMAPLPAGVEHWIEAFLQHRSADAAYLLLNLSGTPVLRDDTILRLPGITLQVAPECSGIRSSLVLILTSLLAGHFFFKRTWSKVVLVGSVVVLGILRNAFRIFTLAQLCIHISPRMIDSPLHHRGGPIFFAISMIPFLFLIWYLRQIESRRSKTGHINP